MTPAAIQTQPLRTFVEKLPPLLGTVGLLAVGKDYVLQKEKYQIVGFADPLYEIARFAFGTSDKSKPGMRQFLQTVGQWGRGTVSEEYPLTTDRSTFIANRIMNAQNTAVAEMRDKLKNKFGVNWVEWGTPDIWANALSRRLRSSFVGPVAVSNVRFQNEVSTLKACGAQVWLVACTPAELKARRKASGYTAAGTEDVSELFAKSLLQSVSATGDGILRYGDPGAERVEVPALSVISGVVWNSAEAELDKYLRPEVPVYIVSQD